MKYCFGNRIAATEDRDFPKTGCNFRKVGVTLAKVGVTHE